MALLVQQAESHQPVNYGERLQAYTKLLEQANRSADTTTRDTGLVKSFINHINDKHLAFRTDVLNEYLYSHYKTYHSRKRAGNEIVRFAVQTMGMAEGQISFIKPIKPAGRDEKIVMSAQDNEAMLAALSAQKKFTLVQDNYDRYRAALILLMSTGCRPVEACKAAKEHFTFSKATKLFTLELPASITKTGEEYKWTLPARYNHVWNAMRGMSAKLKSLDYDQLRAAFIECEKGLGIDTRFTMKSIRKMVATKEYASHVRQEYLK